VLCSRQRLGSLTITGYSKHKYSVHKKTRAFKGEKAVSTAFQKIGTDSQLQDHWLRRLIAGIIDGVIISIIAFIISTIAVLPDVLLGAPFVLGTFSFLNGILFFLYAAFLESIYGTTLGKQFMNLRVTRMDGRIASFDRTVIRDASKIYWLLWLIDTLIGMATVGDPHQKFTDRYAGTTVISTIQRPMILPSAPASPVPSPPSS
jgi:uncharacterized RDD family membrane protein YckC